MRFFLPFLPRLGNMFHVKHNKTAQNTLLRGLLSCILLFAPLDTLLRLKHVAATPQKTNYTRRCFHSRTVRLFHAKHGSTQINSSSLGHAIRHLACSTNLWMFHVKQDPRRRQRVHVCAYCPCSNQSLSLPIGAFATVSRETRRGRGKERAFFAYYPRSQLIFALPAAFIYECFT